MPGPRGACRRVPLDCRLAAGDARRAGAPGGAVACLRGGHRPPSPGAGVRRGHRAATRSVGRARHGQQDRGGGSGGRRAAARRIADDRPARRDTAPRPHRRALAHLPAPVQRDAMERPGAEGVAGLPHHRGHAPLPAHAHGRLHHAARPRHRGRGLRGRRRAARDRRGPHPGTAAVRRHARDRGHRQLRAGAEGLRAGVRAARRGRRKRAAPRRS